MRKILTSYFLVLVLAFYSITPVFSDIWKVSYETQNVILPVNSYAFEDHDPTKSTWGHSGISPWIDTQDEPANTINSGGLNFDDGNYTFSNLPARSRNVTSVNLYAYVDNDGAGGTKAKINFHPHNGTVWDTTFDYFTQEILETDPYHYEIVDLDVNGFIDSVPEVDNCEIWFVSTDFIGSPYIVFDYAYLNVTVEVEVPYERGNYPIRNVLGLVGLTLMVAAPTYGVWEIRQKNYEGAVSAFVVSAIGYAFTLAWLIP